MAGFLAILVILIISTIAMADTPRLNFSSVDSSVGGNQNIKI
jgi:hypothetical protein